MSADDRKNIRMTFKSLPAEEQRQILVDLLEEHAYYSELEFLQWDEAPDNASIRATKAEGERDRARGERDMAWKKIDELELKLDHLEAEYALDHAIPVEEGVLLMALQKMANEPHGK